ncbi:MAG: helix-turn-helix domain-containing protein, partial [Natronospirillum sp.]
PGLRMIILTGYSSIATAVAAMQLGAINYVCKPANADEILVAFEADTSPAEQTEVPDNPPSVKRLQWEHVQKVLRENEGNISMTARALGMHRRTLQRILQKKPVNR